MDKQSSFQAGFWIGGNLPWSSDAAGASFENVRLRMYNPGTWYYGWHLYGETEAPVRINNCTISAAGATDVIPVYIYGDSQVVTTNGLALINMPDANDSMEFSWSGYPLSSEYSQIADSDGDGLIDDDEIHLFGTDIWLKDSDGDMIDDENEIYHGANPTNQNAYCYDVQVAFTNLDSAIVNFNLAFYNPETGARVSLVKGATNRVNVIHLHCNVESGINPELHIWCTNEEHYAQIPYSVTGHDVNGIIPVQQIHALYDNDNDGMPDEWESRYGLSSIDPIDAYRDDDGDGLINIHEYMTGCNPLVSDGTNTALSVCTKSVDARIHGHEPQDSLAKFVDYTTSSTNFVPNQFFWANDIDTSCASMWNDALTDYWSGTCNPWNKAGTAISKRHIITAYHYAIPIGTTVWFKGTDGALYSRVVTGIRSAGADICIQSLNEDLPECIRPAKILPANYYDYLFDASQLPVVTFDQEEKLLVADSSALQKFSNRSIASSALRPKTANRSDFYESIISGDSGNPRFLVFDTEVVLLYVMHYGGTGSGTFVTHFKNEIQRAMDALCPGYLLQEIDLEQYETVHY